jgi:predicted NBD/HSP70 family sugar kinase
MSRTSNIDVKRLNRNRVFQYINSHDRLSKPELALALGMSAPTILFITNELIEKGVVREEGVFESTGGRKAKALSPIHDARFSLGLDITQNHISMVLTNLSGTVLRHSRIQKRFENTAQYRKDIAESLLAFRNETNISDERLLGVGISLPGIIDMGKKTLAYSHILGVFNVPYEEFSRDIPLPAAFTNDANAAALAELHSRQDDTHALYISLSNSIGGALIFRKAFYLGEKKDTEAWQSNNLFMGEHFREGEIGHMTLVPGGAPCYCGKKGCFDAYCSAKTLARHTDGRLELFFERLKAGDQTLQIEWGIYLDNLATQINSLRMLMDCKVIVGGYVGSFIEPYLEDLRRRLRERDTFGDDGGYVEVCTYRLEASALGAALLHIEAYIKTI